MLPTVCRNAALCARSFSRNVGCLPKLMSIAKCSSKSTAEEKSNAATEEYFQLIQDAQRERVSGRKGVAEPTETKRRRLLLQSSKRGTLETTLLLGEYARLKVPQMTAAQLDAFDRLMNETECEWDIYLWAIGKSEPPEQFAEAVRQLRTYQPLVDYAKAKAAVQAKADSS